MGRRQGLRAIGRSWALDRPSFSFQGRLDRLNLKRLVAVIAPSQDLDASGQLRGDVQISWTGGAWNCRGDVGLTNLKLASLQSRRLRVGCTGDQLQLEPTTLRFGSFEAFASGSVALSRRFDLRADLRNSDASPKNKDPLKLQITGPWEEPQWSVDGQIQLPESMGLNTALTVDGQWRTPWRQPERRAVLLDRLRFSAPGLTLGLAGTIGSNLDVRSTDLRIDPRFWSSVPSLQAGLGQTAPILGTVNVSGGLVSPDLTLKLGQAANPLVEHWSFQTRWSMEDSALVLDRFASPLLQGGSSPSVAAEAGADSPVICRAALNFNRLT